MMNITYKGSVKNYFSLLPTIRFRKMFLILSLFLGFTMAASAQTRDLGPATEFKNSLTGGANLRGARPTLQTTDATYPILINVIKTIGLTDTIVGEVSGSHGSHFMFTVIDGKLEGLLIVPLLKKAYRFYTDASGHIQVEAIDIHKLICADFSKYVAPQEAAPVAVQTVPPSTSSVYHLQSLAGATAVAYLDFDGEVSTTSYWNGGKTINAQPGNFTETDITNVFNLVSEDYRPFNINITTDLAVFNAAPINQRMRCIFTPTDSAAPGSGGVAYVGSFSWNNDVPCWVFNSGAKAAGDAASHELGHTFGLSHDGRELPTTGHEEYYAGAGIWAPIMGVGYYKGLVQWSKGEYTYANNQEDDVAIISNTTNKFGYRADEAGNTAATAKALVIGTNGTVTGTQNSGIITTQADVDVYSFTTTGGTVTLTATPAIAYPNLDILLTLTNASGTVLASIDPTTVSSGNVSSTAPLNGLNATVTATLAAGTYYISVDGAGQGDLTTGYTDYGSIGDYTLSGTVPVSSNPAPVISITSPANNATFTAPASITINATATDDGSVTKVDFYNGTTLLGTDTSSPYSFAWTGVAAGTYTIRAIATDNLGATATASVNVTVTASNPPPVVSITSPANNTTFTAPASITINATATDNGSVTKVDFYNGTTLLGTDTSSPYSFAWTGVAAGTYTIRATATDNLGAISTTSVTITVTASTATVATVYKDCNYGGYAIPLAVGSYTLTQLRAKGALNDDISSVQVQSGYEILLYTDDNFSGNAILIRSNVSCLVNYSFNDITSSLIVRPSTAGAATPAETNSNPSMSVYPNPTNDRITVEFSNIDQQVLYITVLDAYGQEAFSTHVHNGGQINLAGLPVGIYSLRAVVDGTVLVNKILKR